MVSPEVGLFMPNDVIALGGPQYLSIDAKASIYVGINNQL